MKIREIKPPRTFEVGFEQKITLKDCAHIELAPDEQITLTTPSGTEYDICRKSWGYYATPSLNGRLPDHRLHAFLVKSEQTGKYNIFLMEEGKDREFEDYLKLHGHRIVCRLDRSDGLNDLEKKVSR